MYNSKNLDHLGLVAGMVDELGIPELIDKLIVQDQKQRRVSCGTLTKALILNGLGFSQRRLYLCSSFFEDKPVEHLLGQGVEASHLNDDALGRCLDALYDYGLTDMFSQTASNAVAILGLGVDTLHQDTTSFHVDGAYKRQQSDEGSQGHSPDEPSAIRLTKGYSRDHRPELNQVILNLICEGKAGIPLHMQAVSGNQNDAVTMQKTIEQHAEQLQNVYKFDYYVADSALYNQTSLEALGSRGWITRVPERLKEVKELKSRLADDSAAFKTLDDNYSYATHSSCYAGVEQHWMLIKSQQAAQRETKTLVRKTLKDSSKAVKAFNKLKSQRFSCQADALKAAGDFTKQYPFVELQALSAVAYAKYAKAGKPSKRDKPVISYGLTAHISCQRSYFEQKSSQTGFFVLATNESDREALPEKKILALYKAQNASVERGFRFLKDPQFLASTMFVKKPQRVEAILFVMTLCLMVYAALEFRIRQCLMLSGLSVPDQKGKSTERPTARWAFALFKGIHLLEADNETLILNLKNHHPPLIRKLGEKYRYYYKL